MCCLLLEMAETAGGGCVMAGGLRYESMADMPRGLREKYASQQMGRKKLVEVYAAEPQKVKYHSRKVTADGRTFDSVKEYRRFLQLMDAIREGAIYDLRLQQNFTLQEGYTTPEGERIRGIVYQADFTYRVNGAVCCHVPTGVSFADLEYWRRAGDGALIIEDVKSKATRTRVYINKYKMMADRGYAIREV